jgi:hypothetical protein
MDIASAFARGTASRNKPLMVFDWNKAARLIKERKPKKAAAGLRADWEWTGGIIYSDGKPVSDSYTFLASTWAVPELDLDGELTPCYVMESETSWNQDTKWPRSALEILDA